MFTPSTSNRCYVGEYYNRATEEWEINSIHYFTNDICECGKTVWA